MALDKVALLLPPGRRRWKIIITIIIIISFINIIIKVFIISFEYHQIVFVVLHILILLTPTRCQ